MAKRSMRIEPEKTVNVPVDPMKKADSVNRPKTLIIAFDGSWTFHGNRYEGVYEWPENDERLIHAKGTYRIIGEK